MLRRDWSDAIDRWAGIPCLVCGRWPRELAHVVGREYDERRGVKRDRAYVHPDAVVPLCQKHHREYDSHRLDLLPYLPERVVAWAIMRVGRGKALARIRTKRVYHQQLTSSEGGTQDGSDTHAPREHDNQGAD